MSIWSRIANVFRADRLRSEIEEELESHLSEAVEMGQTPSDARKALGSVLRHREASRDIRVLGWLDSLRADVIFGWRQLRKNKVSSTAVIFSLALAIGSCTAAFRLIDALLLRPLPVAEPNSLYALSHESIDPDGRSRTIDSYEYPMFSQMREAVRDQAELIAISPAERVDLTYGSDAEMEKARLQYVSGTMFGVFGLRPAIGRLLAEADDLTPNAHPYAVLSYDYWTNRFGRDPNVIGRAFNLTGTAFTIIGRRRHETEF